MRAYFISIGAFILCDLLPRPKIFQQASKLWYDGWVEQGYSVLLKLQESLLPIVKNALIALTVLFILLLATYLVSISIHARQKRYIVGKTAQWQSMLQRLVRGERSLDDFNIPRKERKYFRDILIAEFFSHRPGFPHPLLHSQELVTGGLAPSSCLLEEEIPSFGIEWRTWAGLCFALPRTT